MVITRLSSQYTSFKIGSAGFTAQQNRRIGEFAKETVLKRVARGIGSDDTPMPQLSGADDSSKRYLYANQKFRKTGSRIRDLKFTGDMLDNLSVRSADEDQVTIAFTSRSAREKAWMNEQRAAWLSFSDMDVRLITAFAASLFAQNVRSISQGLFSRGGARKAA